MGWEFYVLHLCYVLQAYKLFNTLKFGSEHYCLGLKSGQSCCYSWKTRLFFFFLRPSDAYPYPSKQKIPSRKHNHDEEAATNVGTFELINCKEVQTGALCFILAYEFVSLNLFEVSPFHTTYAMGDDLIVFWLIICIGICV